MNPILYLLALPVLTDSLLLVQILKEREFFTHKGSLALPATVIVPIRDWDISLEGNVKSLLSQDFPPGYQVVYVIDQDQQWLAERLKGLGVEVVTSDFPCRSCSGKIRAQLSGLRRARNQVVVFADSDTFYPPHWLKGMVSRLENYTAVTTFSWPRPIRASLRNVLRAGFWTLGFESQALNGTFLWGGSMAFRRDFLDREVEEELSGEWCDDCTLTRIVKRRGGRIAFLGDVIPINIYDEKDLARWSSRQIVTIVKYSPRGAKAYLVVGGVFSSFLILFLISLNPIFLSPLLLWIIKNLHRSHKLGKESLLPSFASVLGLYFAWIMLILNYRRDKVYWRGREYKL
jgi:Glycosyltransferases, probably involved in cell wall biogenesis